MTNLYCVSGSSPTVPTAEGMVGALRKGSEPDPTLLSLVSPIQHPQAQDFICPECNGSFPSRRNFGKHVHADHTDKAQALYNAVTRGGEPRTPTLQPFIAKFCHAKVWLELANTLEPAAATEPTDSPNQIKETENHDA